MNALESCVEAEGDDLRLIGDIKVLIDTDRHRINTNRTSDMWLLAVNSLDKELRICPSAMFGESPAGLLIGTELGQGEPDAIL